MKGKRLLILGAALALGLSACANGATLVRKTPLKAAGDTVTDVLFAKGFGNYTNNSFSAAGTDRTGKANSTNSSDVTYALQVFNGSTGAVRGNQNSGGSNFSARNTTSYDNHYISSVSLTVSSGTIDGSTNDRSLVYFGSSAFANPNTTAPTGTATTASPSSASQSTLTWTNNDTSCNFFVLYNLKTAGTALSANATTSLKVVWTEKDSGVGPDPIPATSVTIGSHSTSLFAGKEEELQATVLPNDTTDNLVYSSSNTAVASVSGNKITALAEGTTTITATAGSVSDSYTLSVSYVNSAQNFEGAKINSIGKLIAKNGKNAIIEDGYGAFWAYASSNVTQDIGTTVRVTGTSTVYSGGLEVGGATIETVSNQDINPVEATPLTESEINSYYTASFVPTRKVSLTTGEIGGSGDYLTWSYFGHTMETNYSTGGMITGNQYDVEGYIFKFFTDKNNNNEVYLVIVITEATLVAGSSHIVEDVDAIAIETSIHDIKTSTEEDNSFIAKATGVAENHYGNEQYGNFYLVNPTNGEYITIYGGYTNVAFEENEGVYSSISHSNPITNAIIGKVVTVYSTISIHSGVGQLANALVVPGDPCVTTVSCSVDVNDNTMGSASLSATSTTYGSEVVVSANPSDGYKVKSISIERATKSEPVEAVEGVYKFNAQSKNVVTVTFELDSSAQINYAKIAEYDFSSGNTSTGKYNSGEELVARFASSAKAGAGLSDIVDEASSLSNVYAAYDSNHLSFGIKFGTSSAEGTFTISLTKEVLRVVVVAAGWGTGDSLTVGDAPAQTPGVAYNASSPFKTLTFDISASDSIEFTFANRGFIKAIDFYAEGEEITDPQAYLDYASSYKTITGNDSVIGGLENDIVFGELFNEDTTLSSENPIIVGSLSLKADKDSGSSEPKYYSSGAALRVYAKNTITITTTGEDNISRIEFIYSQGNIENLTADTGSISFGVWSGSSKSVVFTNNDSSQMRFTTIKVYTGVTSFSVTNLALRFGASISVSDWEAINNNEDWEITDYGVMFFATTEDYLDSAPTVKSAYTADENSVKIARKGSGTAPTARDGYYSFSGKISITSTANYDMYICAAAFIVINDTDYYFVGDEMQESVRTLAANNDGTNLSKAALQYLITYGVQKGE